MRIAFGYNRRQKPVIVWLPGGSIRLTREPHGTVLVELRADKGYLKLGENKDYEADLRVVVQGEAAK